MGPALEILMLETGQPDHALACARRGPDIVVEKLPFGAGLDELLSWRERLDAASAGNGRKITPAELIEFGDALKTYLFRGELGNILSAVGRNQTVSLEIVATHDRLHRVPWEYTRFGGDPGPAAFRRVVRIATGAGWSIPPPLNLGQQKPSVLAVAADPTDADHVEWDSLVRAVERQLFKRLGIKPRVVPGSDGAKLRQALRTGKADIFHFSGHGAHDSTGGVLLLRGPGGKREPIKATDLGPMLAAQQIRVAILSACRTASGGIDSDFRATAETLLQSGVPAVVANQFSVTQPDAIRFASAMYESLLASGDIDKAVQDARTELWAGGAGSFEWGIPVLYRLAGSAKILEVGQA